MKVFRIDVKFYATAYIKADSAEEALVIAKTMKGDCLTVPEGEHLESDIVVSGAQYDSPGLPDESISPILTCHGPDDDAYPDCVEGDEDEDATV
jgi:hypothetical protein